MCACVRACACAQCVRCVRCVRMRTVRGLLRGAAGTWPHLFTYAGRGLSWTPLGLERQ